jgi:hypothetical protein
MLPTLSFHLHQNAKEHDGGKGPDNTEQDHEVHRQIDPRKYRSDVHNLCS